MRILHHMIGGRSSLSAYRSVRKISSSMFRETLSLGSYPVRIGSMGALQACPGSPTCESTCRFSRALCMPLLSVLSAKVASQHTIHIPTSMPGLVSGILHTSVSAAMSVTASGLYSPFSIRLQRVTLCMQI